MQFIRAHTDADTIVCDVGRLLGNNCFSNVEHCAVPVANPESKAFVLTRSGKAQKFMRFFNRQKRNTDIHQICETYHEGIRFRPSFICVIPNSTWKVVIWSAPYLAICSRMNMSMPSPLPRRWSHESPVCAGLSWYSRIPGRHRNGNASGVYPGCIRRSEE